MTVYRNTGAIGALLDEYERAIADLDKVLTTITPAELITLADPHTSDPDCKSIQRVLTHIIRAGYGYAIAVRRSLGEQVTFAERETLDTVEAYRIGLWKMFEFNKNLFDDYPDIVTEELDNDKKILSRWGQLYDVEQLFEHAIVHILRHRRQIEHFLVKLRT